MTSRSRYTLVALGITAFLVFSPFIVMYVTGTRYDRSAHRFVKTGAVAASTSPKGAKILLNGSFIKKTPGTVRFLNPGDYTITLSKTDYFDWTKRLYVKAQYVTWANRDLESITLFYKNPKTLNIHGNVLGFLADQKHLVYVTTDSIYGSDTDSPTESRHIQLPQNISQPVFITASPDKHLYLVQSGKYSAVYNFSSNTLVDISTVLNSSDTLDRESIVKQDQFSNLLVQFLSNNQLLILQNQTLSSLDLDSNKKTTLLSNVLAFTPQNDVVYIINTNHQLVHVQLPSLDSYVLTEKLPVFYDATLFVSNENEIFILADQNLYAVGQSLQKISDYVKSVQIINQFHKVLYTTVNEVALYDTRSQTSSLITRSSKPIKDPVVNLGLGWSFFINDNRLQALEIDDRDHQNNYTFAEANETSTFTIDEKAKKLFLLTDGTLEQLTIR